MRWRNRNFKKQFFVVVVFSSFFRHNRKCAHINVFFLQAKKTHKHIKNRYAEDKVKVNCLNGFIAFYSLLSSEVFSSFHVFHTLSHIRDVYTYLRTYSYQRQKCTRFFSLFSSFTQMSSHLIFFEFFRRKKGTTVKMTFHSKGFSPSTKPRHMQHYAVVLVVMEKAPCKIF